MNPVKILSVFVLICAAVVILPAEAVAWAACIGVFAGGAVLVGVVRTRRHERLSTLDDLEAVELDQKIEAAKKAGTYLDDEAVDAMVSLVENSMSDLGEAFGELRQTPVMTRGEYGWRWSRVSDAVRDTRLALDKIASRIPRPVFKLVDNPSKEPQPSGGMATAVSEMKAREVLEEYGCVGERREIVEGVCAVLQERRFSGATDEATREQGEEHKNNFTDMYGEVLYESYSSMALEELEIHMDTIRRVWSDRMDKQEA